MVASSLATSSTRVGTSRPSSVDPCVTWTLEPARESPAKTSEVTFSGTVTPGSMVRMPSMEASTAVPTTYACNVLIARADLASPPSNPRSRATCGRREVAAKGVKPCSAVTISVGT